MKKISLKRPPLKTNNQQLISKIPAKRKIVLVNPKFKRPIRKLKPAHVAFLQWKAFTLRRRILKTKHLKVWYFKAKAATQETWRKEIKADVQYKYKRWEVCWIAWRQFVAENRIETAKHEKAITFGIRIILVAPSNFFK